MVEERATAGGGLVRQHDAVALRELEAVGVAVVAAEPAMPAPHAGAVPVFVMTTSVITSRLPAGTANALTGAPAATVRVTVTICSMPTGVPVTGVDGVVVPGVGVVPEPVTVVVLPVVVAVTPPDVLGVVDVDGETWVSGDTGEEIPADGPMMKGDVAAVAIPAPTRIRTTTTSFRMIRAMLLPPASGCAGGSQTLCRQAKVANTTLGDRETQPIDRERR